MERRSFLTALGAAAAANAAEGRMKPKVCIFSKHLQFLQGEQLASAVASMGYDGIDLTVRKNGHVLPESVAKDLPPLVKLIRSHGLEVPMVTTEIVDADTPHAESVLRTLSELGIHHYRWDAFRYDDKTPLAAQIEALKPRVAKLAQLNAKYKTGAMYHTHSGINLVGASIWDLYILMKDLDPAAVGVNYDIGHATIEGGFGGWINSFRITGPHLRGIAVKDCLWAKDNTGVWKSRWVPLGEGMVKLKQFCAMVQASGFQGPVQLHFEYPLGGADKGATSITMDKSEVFTAMKRDLGQLRQYFA